MNRIPSRIFEGISAKSSRYNPRGIVVPRGIRGKSLEKFLEQTQLAFLWKSRKKFEEKSFQNPCKNQTVELLQESQWEFLKELLEKFKNVAER